MKGLCDRKNAKYRHPTLWVPGLFCLVLAVFLSLTASGQKKQVIQIKAFDQQLTPFRNIELSINGKEFVVIGAKGEAFTELPDTDFPLKSIRVKDEKLEAASWNYSKGILEVIVRKKNYHIAHVTVKDLANAPLPKVRITFNGRKVTTAVTNGDGQVEIPLALDEKINSTDQFTVDDYVVKRINSEGTTTTVSVDKIIQSLNAEEKKSEPKKEQQPATSKNYLKNFNFSKLDSIQSLTVFYAIFKNSQMKDLSEDQKEKVDRKFDELVEKLQDSLRRSETQFMGRISDSSFVQNDIKNLLSQAERESKTLEAQRTEFDQKVQMIQEKLEKGIQNLDEKTRNELLSDLARLEILLTQNENRFYKNQNDYRATINTIKEKYFDLTDLENKLSMSEAQRVEEQRAFREKLFWTFGVLLVFTIFILMLVYFSARLKRQKAELVRVNAEIKRINENLEGIVAERTKLLAEANKELDTFLYRASHDLRSPVCSIIGLCNIAMLLSNGEAKDLVERMVHTTSSMDKLLKKLSVISEINQPSNFSSITLVDVIENIRDGFSKLIEDQRINFVIDCPADLTIYSYPNLIETILVNLIENAFFYSVMRNSSDPQVELKAAVRGDELELSLYDNGIGVEDKISHRLFDMFFKGNENSKGNGLGLYIVQKSVQALEGKIKVESQPGEFTKFIIHIPLNQMTTNPKVIAMDKSQLQEVHAI